MQARSRPGFSGRGRRLLLSQAHVDSRLRHPVQALSRPGTFWKVLCSALHAACLVGGSLRLCRRPGLWQAPRSALNHRRLANMNACSSSVFAFSCAGATVRSFCTCIEDCQAIQASPFQLGERAHTRAEYPRCFFFLHGVSGHSKQGRSIREPGCEAGLVPVPRPGRLVPVPPPAIARYSRGRIAVWQGRSNSGLTGTSPVGLLMLRRRPLCAGLHVLSCIE